MIHLLKCSILIFLVSVVQSSRTRGFLNLAPADAEANRRTQPREPQRSDRLFQAKACEPNCFGRRALSLDVRRSFAFSACMESVFPSQCHDEMEDFNLDQHVSALQDVGDDRAALEEWSAKMVSVYCCKLRSGSRADLRTMSFDFPNMCFESRVQSALQNIASVAADNNSGLFWTLTVIDFCPNVAIPEAARRPSHFQDLYAVAINTQRANADQLKEQAVHDCKAGISNGEDLVDLTILFPQEQAGDWQHVIAFWGSELTAESYIDWMPSMSFSSWFTLATQAEYTLLNGIGGYFRSSPVKMNLASGIRVSGLSKERMVEKMNSIRAEGKYDLMFNNCAHQVSRIAKAGLGCEIREIPFLLPGALQVVGKEIGQVLTAEELEIVQDRLNEIGAEETFTTVRRLVRRVLFRTANGGKN